MAIPHAGIFGVAGTTLTDKEKSFFSKLNPLGFILFARNCESPAQVKSLVTSLRDTVAHDNVFVLIDQEGGRVARLKPPHWRKTPPAGVFASLAQKSLSNAKRAVYENARLIAGELHVLGINVDCAPLADVPVAGAHDIIGDRAYGTDPAQVSALGREMARGLLEGSVLPVLKHIPGHGRAFADSHDELPIVDASLETLRQSDFIPFKALRDLPLGMTAHILYTAIDATRPATLSAKVLEIVRKEIGFDGLLMSDDLSMKALKGDFAELTTQSIHAGCDIILHCNGKMEEMSAVAAVLKPLSNKAYERFAKASAQLVPPSNFDSKAAEANLATLTN